MRATLILALFAGADATCSSWCNTYTCDSNSCDTCDVCATLSSGSYCAFWCNSYTCGYEHCAGCAQCPPAVPLPTAQLGPRPQFLVETMRPSALKTSLQQCLAKPAAFFTAHDFSIGHRGACMQFPEHTHESYVAAMDMGAGIIECDVAVTSDGELVCRHSQCDLHQTTNILTSPLANRCSVPFTPADPTAGTSATATCCTSDITLAEYKTLCGVMEAGLNGDALTPEEYQQTPLSRTDLYSTCGTLVSHAESIALVQARGSFFKFTPELKSYTPGAGMPTYDEIRQKVLDEYTTAGVSPSTVWVQSFVQADIEYWIANGGAFGPQAVFLDNAYGDGMSGGLIDSMASLYAAGFRILAPPMQMLVQTTASGYAPSNYAIQARAHGFNLITWTLERSGPLASGGGWYYGTSNSYTQYDGDMLALTHVLAQDVGILGLFSDWPATTTFYANCMMKTLSSAGDACDPAHPACALGLTCRKSGVSYSCAA